jgi:anti-sigma factor RsiW
MNADPDDTTLHAWLDGELPPERGAEVEAWLREHADAAAQMRLWAADAAALHARLDGVLDEPIPPALVDTVWRSASAGAVDDVPAWRWQRLAAGLAVIVLGAAAMWRLQPAEAVALGPDGEPAWVDRAAVAHAVYVPEVRHPVEVGAQEEQHLTRWLTNRLALPVKVFDLTAEGFELVGGRLLPDATGPSAQLMYQSIVPVAKPLRVTVYLRKPDADEPAAFRYEQQGELGLFYWVEGRSARGGPTGYALVGALPRERLLALAEAIYRQGQAAK